MKRLSLESSQSKRRGLIDKSVKSLHIIQDLKGSSIIKVDGVSISPTCLNCVDTPCKEFKTSEILPNVLNGMPANPSTKVCPVNAIFEDKSTGFPVIDPETCFGCGLCFNRCPYGAISLEVGRKAKILHGDSEIVKFAEVDSLAELSTTYELRVSQNRIVTENIPKDGLTTIYKEILRIRTLNQSFENLFTRNVLLCLGINAKIKNIGNNDIRIDLIGKQGENIIAASIDLVGSDTLNIPRYLLDAIAVLHSRHNIDRKSIIPMVIVGSYPNKRSDFFEMLGDIKDVTGFETKTFSLHFLIIMMLLNKALNFDEIKGIFTLSKDKKDIKEEAKVIIPELEKLDYWFESSYYGSIK
ncbi:4Fe-4S dicluster domain-containing protein [Larkinella bovis]|uniref:4Fe-4S dicluster domain-containing protein n=1 Tax=Larkinella bovis TaxID=683041 RepID=A0ABW0IJQ1_9BACT